MQRPARLIPAILAAFTLSLSHPAQAGGGPECWRRGGPPALAALMTQHADAIRLHGEGKPVADWDRISAELDAVAGQRDAWASGLYWYTDLDEAKAAARREHKPIVSLRLLGRLDAELSCANSRFFRTTLYPVADVSKRLRERFILHWSSERPVPVVTVDFGDGRKLERTVTGNSAHYMMTPDGIVVDVLPGLYGAKAFAAWLDESGDLAARVAASPTNDRIALLKAHHAHKRDTLSRQWGVELRDAGLIPPERAKDAKQDAKSVAPGKAAPNARLAGRIAIGKSFVERPMVTLLAAADPDSADGPMWASIAERHEKAGQLDPAALRVVQSKRPGSDAKAVIATLQRAITIDTLRNEYLLHARVHDWFAGNNPPTAFEPLNEMVYAQLFLTPRSDPWLGLAPKNAWSGLEDDGLTTTASASPATAAR